MINKKTLGIGALVATSLAGALCVAATMIGDGNQVQLNANQSYVYAYITEIKGNEMTYSELDEAVVTAYLEQQEEAEEDTENDAASEGGRPDMGEMPSGGPGGEMPDRGEMPNRGEMPGGDRMFRDDNIGMMSREIITTLIPVGITVHTQADTETTFQRLATGDMIKMIVETTEDGKEVITEIWML